MNLLTNGVSNNSDVGYSYYDEFYMKHIPKCNDVSSMKLSYEDVQVIKSVFQLWGLKYPYIGRKPNGDLGVFKHKDFVGNIFLDSHLLPNLPRGKFIDVKECVGKRMS